MHSFSSVAPEMQNERTNQQMRVENQLNHPLEASGDLPRERNGRTKRGGVWQPRFRDDEQRFTPPLGSHRDGFGSGQQQVVDDDKAKFIKRK